MRHPDPAWAAQRTRRNGRDVSRRLRPCGRLRAATPRWLSLYRRWLGRPARSTTGSCTRCRFFPCLPVAHRRCPESGARILPIYPTLPRSCASPPGFRAKTYVLQKRSFLSSTTAPHSCPFLPIVSRQRPSLPDIERVGLSVVLAKLVTSLEGHRMTNEFTAIIE